MKILVAPTPPPGVFPPPGKKYTLAGFREHWIWINVDDRDDYLGPFRSEREAIEQGRKVGSVLT